MSVLLTEQVTFPTLAISEIKVEAAMSLGSDSVPQYFTGSLGQPYLMWAVAFTDRINARELTTQGRLGI